MNPCDRVYAPCGAGVQHRRYVGPHDRRTLPLAAAPRGHQLERPRSIVDPAVLRFFDPAFAWRVSPVPGASAGTDDSGRRWDGANLQAFEGTYGDYVTAKVGKVFPELRQRVAGG
jgi:hypothetical protein